MASHKPFQITRPVQPSEIDMMGHVNNTVYLQWVQEIAVAHWQALASPQAQQEIAWVVLRHEIDYKTPALLGDDIGLETWVGQATGLTFERHTRIWRASDQQLLAQARTLWCPISATTGRPRRVGAEIRAQFSTQSNTSNQPELA